MGRMWRMAWEDGMAGVYKFEGATSVGVKRKHELLSADDPQLVDQLPEKVQMYAQQNLLGECVHSQISPV